MKTAKKHLSIVFVCAEYPYRNQATGGFGRYVEQISQALAKRGHKITIICQGKKPRQLTKNNCKILVIRPTGFKFWLWLQKSRVSFVKRLGEFLAYPVFFSFKMAQVLKQLTQQSKIDIIEGGEYAGELFFWLTFRPKATPKTIIKLHTPAFLIRHYNQEQNSLFYRVLEKLEKYCITQADAVYSPSKSLAKIITAETQVEISSVIYHPFAPAKANQRFRRHQHLVLYAGKLQTKKGVFVLAESIPQVIDQFPKTKFIFVGPDTLEDGQSIKRQLKRRLRQTNCLNQVKFMGNLAKVKLYKLYQQTTITVIPSLWDNSSFVALEAASFKSPLIVAKAGGITEIFSHQAAVYIAPDNSDQLAKAIISLLKSPPRRQQLAARAFKVVAKQFQPAFIAKQTQKYYRRWLE